MKIPRIILVFISVYLMGCNDEIMNNDIDSLAITAEQAEKILTPLKTYTSDYVPTISKKGANSLVTKTIKFHSSSGSFDFVIGASECPDSILVLISGEGNATHLGHFSVLNTYCSDGENPISPIKGLLTAANGDQINTMVIGVNYDPEVGFIYDYIILSGTGRFYGVTGNITMYGIIDVPNLFWSLRGEGQITY